MSVDCQRDPITQMVYGFSFNLLNKRYWKDGHILHRVVEEDLLALVKRALEKNKEQPANTAAPCESYPAPWIHATIHLNPVSGEMHSDGNHEVRRWIQEKIGALPYGANNSGRDAIPLGTVEKV